MKGQLSADFFISLTLFILLTSYFLVRVLDIMPSFLHEEKMQSLRGTAYAISELLINDAGEPKNWQTLQLSQIKRIGLMDEEENLTNFVSLDKINRLNAICNSPNNTVGYPKIKELLGIDEDVNVSVVIKNLNTNEDIASCWPPSLRLSRIVNISRVVSYKEDSELIPAEVLIMVGE